jgi:hypothetical protein
MSLYFMHLRDGTDVILDPDGVEMAPEAVAKAALAAARDCIAGDARNGSIDLRYWIDVHDESDAVIHSLHFADAVTINPA